MYVCMYMNVCMYYDALQFIHILQDSSKTYLILSDFPNFLRAITVLCDHPYLVSLLFAVLVSLHPVTFLLLVLA